MLKRILVFPLDLILFIWAWVVYLISGERTKRSHSSMLRLFCVTKGYSSEMVHNIITFFRRPYKMPKNISSLLGQYTEDQIQDIAKHIEEDGYYILGTKLSDELIEDLKSFAQNTQAYIRPYFSDGSAVVDRKQVNFNSENPESIRYDWHAVQLLENKTVQKLIADDLFIAISQAYLKSAPIIDGVRMWWNTNFSNEPNSEAATMYHYDMERIKWFKIFVYLTDVNKENGPHAFIKGTHKAGSLPFSLLKKGYFMSHDEEIFKYFDKKNEVVYTASKGTVIIEDTKGLHKGMPVKKGDRLIFQMQFSDSMFAMESDATLPENRVPELVDAIAKYPKVFQYYNRA